MSNEVIEAIDLLASAGVIDRLKNEAQAERELERAELLDKLLAIEEQDTTLGAVLADGIVRLSGVIADLEKKLARARGELSKTTAERSALGTNAQQMRFRLRQLADPAIDAAIVDLTHVAERARREFRATTEYSPVDPISGKRTARAISNGEPVSQLLEACATARGQLEALKEAPRPADLPEIIDRLLVGVRANLRALVGVQ